MGTVNILGISAYYHDSAAALVRDGEIVAAAQEERFSREKHDARLPKAAIDYCLKAGGITIHDIDYIAYYDKPFLTFDRILETYLAYAPRGVVSFTKAMPLWLKQKLLLPRLIRKELGYHGWLLFCEHHESHAASAFFPSPFRQAAILTLDGVGEWATTTYGVGIDNRIDLTREIRFPHSLGLLYSAFTYFTGFRVNSGEYKMMGLAPYGEPRYTGTILDHLIDLKEDGSFRLNLGYFAYPVGLRMTNSRFEKLFGGPPRRPGSAITQREMDIARSIQDVTEEIMLRCARTVHEETGMRHLCLAGGVALNCVGNGRLLREGPFDDLWVQPAAGDAGGSLGSALFVWHQLLGHPRRVDGRDLQKASLLGPSYSNDEIEGFLRKKGVRYRRADPEQLPREVAGFIDAGKVVGWFQGRMEFGPRALGARSILGDPRSSRMQSIMNRKIKFRESFRPFAPTVLAERTGEYFDLDRPSPYMLLVAPVREEVRLPVADEGGGLEKLHVVRSKIPAVTHVDYSARIQTVSRGGHPRYHALLEAFEERTGCPLVINTSFNIRGEPIVCTPDDAYRCFMRTNMDVLVLEDFIVEKGDQEPIEADIDPGKEYELD